MIATEIVLAVIGGVVAVSAALYDARKKSIPCNSCAHLICKFRGGKYVCNGNIFYTVLNDEFYTPPKYCAKYKKKETDDG